MYIYIYTRIYIYIYRERERESEREREIYIGERGWVTYGKGAQLHNGLGGSFLNRLGLGGGLSHVTGPSTSHHKLGLASWAWVRYSEGDQSSIVACGWGCIT